MTFQNNAILPPARKSPRHHSGAGLVPNLPNLLGTMQMLRAMRRVRGTPGFTPSLGQPYLTRT